MEECKRMEVGFIGTRGFLALCCVIPLLSRFCPGKPHSQRWGCTSSQESFSQRLGKQGLAGGDSGQEKFCPEQRSPALPVPYLLQGQLQWIYSILPICNKAPLNPARENLASFFPIFPHRLLMSTETNQKYCPNRANLALMSHCPVL